jgi:hypothetical protein
VKLNPIGEEKPAEERMRGKGKPPEEKRKEKYRKPAGGRGMISGLAMRVSAGSFFKMPIFSALCNSFSRNLVWTQLPKAGASASMVLAFFMAVPVAASAAVELLLPMAMLLNQKSTGNGRRDVRQERCARRKMMTAAEWGKQLLPLFFLLSPCGKLLAHPSRAF